MAQRSIDPSKAVVDIDVMDLTSFTLSPAHTSLTADGSLDGEPVGLLLEAHLAGGLGRITVGERIILTDQVDDIAVTGLFTDLTGNQHAELRDLLEGWATMNTPLRFLDFGDRAMIMEDGTQFIVIPAGPRHVRLRDGHAPFEDGSDG
jgi:hypothetical protein